MNQSFSMEPAAVTDSKRTQHVPPCEHMSREQQAVADRYREQQDAKSKSARKGQELVYSAEQRRALELLASVNCPIAQRDG